jgi:crotonobetainyl-CoA:carnitine CoA-transferase CaiB-like acyl-CoA transferase
MSRTPADYAYPPPLTGEHSETILSERLHLSTDRIEELRKREVI